MASAAHVLPFALRLLLAKKRVFALRGMIARVRMTPYRKVLANGSLFTVLVLCYVPYMVLDAPPRFSKTRVRSRLLQVLMICQGFLAGLVEGFPKGFPRFPKGFPMGFQGFPPKRKGFPLF